MKKHLYILVSLLSLAPSMGTENVTNSLIIASTLVLSNTYSKRTFDKKLSLDLHKAIERGDYTAAQKLIANSQVDVNAKVDYGDYPGAKGLTPLIQCCKIGDQALQIAELLLANKEVKVNLHSKWGDTPLIYCCKAGDKSLRIAKLLLKHKNIDVNLKDVCYTPLVNCCYTPLVKSCYTGDQSLEIAKLLLKHNDIDNIKSHNDHLVACCNTGNKSVKIAELLINHYGIDVNLKNKDGNPPLVECCEVGDRSLKIVKILLAHRSINVNLKNNNGITPLIACSTNQYTSSINVATSLLEHLKINVNLKNSNGDTPLDAAFDGLLNCKHENTQRCGSGCEYVKLWDVLVAQGAVLGKCNNDYNSLNPSDFKEPDKGYIESIKRNPPKSIQSLIQENNLLRKQIEALKKQNEPTDKEEPKEEE